MLAAPGLQTCHSRLCGANFFCDLRLRQTAFCARLQKLIEQIEFIFQFIEFSFHLGLGKRQSAQLFM